MQLLKENCNEEIEAIEYLINTPTQKELKELVKMIGIKPEELVRKKEPLYQDKYKHQKITSAEWIRILSKNPVLIERPIIVKGNKAIIGRPVEKIVEFLV
jgi:arsenate reductase